MSTVLARIDGHERRCCQGDVTNLRFGEHAVCDAGRASATAGPDSFSLPIVKHRNVASTRPGSIRETISVGPTYHGRRYRELRMVA